MQTNLKTRLEAITDTFILRRTEDSLQRQVEPHIAKGRAISYEKHLTNLGIKEQDYDKVYEVAILIHAEQGAKGPFGIDEIVQGALRFKESKAGGQKFVKVLKERVDCVTCKGTGLKFEKGKAVYGVDRKAIKCEECNDNKI